MPSQQPPSSSPSGPPPEPHQDEVRGSVVRLALVIAGTVALGVFAGLPTLLVVLAIVVMIFLHELGHYVTAKWAGMKVTEFFIGFGPKLWSFRRGETEYGLKAIPAGAYVRIIGMHNLEQVDPADEARTYRQKPYWRRLSVALAGSAMHFLIALVLLFVLFVGFGVPKETVWQVGAISRAEQGRSPAERAGLRIGDRVVAIDGERIRTFGELRDEIRDRPGETVTLTVERGDRTFQTRTRLSRVTAEGEEIGFLGVGAEQPLQPLGPVEALGRTVTELGRTTLLSAQALVSFFTPDSLGDYVGKVLDQPSTGTGLGEPVNGDGNRLLSPVGAVRVAAQAAETGVPAVLLFLVAINIFVGLFNLVPLLPFDGGHVAIATYERIRSRGGERYFVDVSKLLPVTYLVVFVLGGLFLTSLYLDIADPLSNPFRP